jgi:hypothetical protein
MGMPTMKISIAVDKELLRRARKAAESEGVSLSRYIGGALGDRLDHQVRLETARELYRTWGSQSVPSEADRKEFLAHMSRPRKHRRKVA